MWRASGALTLLLACLVSPALAQQEMRSNTKGTSIPLPITGTVIDSNHNAIDTNIANLGVTISGEDTVLGVLRVEQCFTCQVFAADAAVKSTPGLVHSVTFTQNDAAPTAGSLILYDNTAESGTQILNHTFTTTTFNPTTVLLDGLFGTGLYAGFTTTADVNVTICYR